MKTPSTTGRSRLLDVQSDVLITVDNSVIRMKADGKYIIMSGNLLGAFLSVKKSNGVFSAVTKVIESTDLILSHVDVNICLYNERFAVMGPKTILVVTWAKSAIIRFFNPK